MPAKLNLLNQKFGRLTVIDYAPNKGKRTYQLCKCECGNIKEISTEGLRSGRTQSCGCLHKEIATQLCRSKIIDLTGQHFGRLTVLEQVESYRQHSAQLCQCKCGNKKIVNSMELKKGDTLSCGCLRSSFGEEKIEKILKENNLFYKKEYSFFDLLSDKNNKLKFDFVIFSDDTYKEILYIIEYDGEQHYLNKTNNFQKQDSLEQRQNRDKIKNEYCIKNNICLYRIPYWEKNNLTLELITSNKYKVM